MALEDAVKGGKRPSQTIVWGDGSTLDLTGATISARIKDESGTTVDSDGTFVVTDGPNSQFRWDYGDNDIASAGNYIVQFTAAFGSAPTPAKTFTADWEVRVTI